MVNTEIVLQRRGSAVEPRLLKQTRTQWEQINEM